MEQSRSRGTGSVLHLSLANLCLLCVALAIIFMLQCGCDGRQCRMLVTHTYAHTYTQKHIHIIVHLSQTAIPAYSFAQKWGFDLFYGWCQIPIRSPNLNYLAHISFIHHWVSWQDVPKILRKQKPLTSSSDFWPWLLPIMTNVSILLTMEELFCLECASVMLLIESHWPMLYKCISASFLKLGVRLLLLYSCSTKNHSQINFE